MRTRAPAAARTPGRGARCQPRPACTACVHLPWVQRWPAGIGLQGTGRFPRGLHLFCSGTRPTMSSLPQASPTPTRSLPGPQLQAPGKIWAGAPRPWLCRPLNAHTGAHTQHGTCMFTLPDLTGCFAAPVAALAPPGACPSSGLELGEFPRPSMRGRPQSEAPTPSPSLPGPGQARPCLHSRCWTWRRYC